MQNLLSWFFFICFALALFGMYRLIRRRQAPPGVVGLVGVPVSIILIVLTALAQGNGILQAAVVGFGVGGSFSIITLMLAWYFAGEENL